jgi:hypothetical protein
MIMGYFISSSSLPSREGGLNAPTGTGRAYSLYGKKALLILHFTEQ